MQLDEVTNKPFAPVVTWHTNLLETAILREFSAFLLLTRVCHLPNIS